MDDRPGSSSSREPLHQVEMVPSEASPLVRDQPDDDSDDAELKHVADARARWRHPSGHRRWPHDLVARACTLPWCLGTVAALVILAFAVVAAIPELRASALTALMKMTAKELQPRPTLKCIPRRVRVPRVEDMTLLEKIGQMTLVDKNALGKGDDVANYMIGAVLSGGGGAPDWGNEAADWADMVDNFQEVTNRTRLKIPILYGADAVHGHNNVRRATIFPHHIGLGATRNPRLVTQIAAATAREVAATGVRWSFAPALSVCRDPRWGRCYESFGDDTEIVRSMTAGIHGWQAKPSDRSDPAYSIPGEVLVAACAKHFVGDGGTRGGRDQGDTALSDEELRAVHLAPYRDAIREGVASVMVSYSSVNGTKMHRHRHLITDVLKGELRFPGVVVSDWQAIQQLPGRWPNKVRDSINAGIDMVMVPTTYEAFIEQLRIQVDFGGVHVARIDDAVRRILLMKERLGLFRDACAPRRLLPEVGSRPHRQLARAAVRESLVLLKNARRRPGGSSGNGGAVGASVFPLPLANGTRVLVAGSHAHNIGLQCGGWTITWQGSSGNITEGTTILEGIYAAAAGASAEVTFVEAPSGREAADYGIVVVGEAPYAEYFGDDRNLRLGRAAVSAIENVCRQMPCVVVLVSGRPLHVTELLPQVDALVAAWLPGSEGAGVADVLFRRTDFKGRLPLSWFRDAKELPLSSYGANNAPLFPTGFGLDKSGKPL